MPNEPITPDLPTLSPSGDGGGATSARGSGRTIPPHPEDSPDIDTFRFARQAGIREGGGVTVVLRVEVRGSGAVGRVEVDVSGGNTRVDRAAIAYVRTLKWVGGRVDDQPETLWIRWGVRLDA